MRIPAACRPCRSTSPILLPNKHPRQSISIFMGMSLFTTATWVGAINFFPLLLYSQASMLPACARVPGSYGSSAHQPYPTQPPLFEHTLGQKSDLFATNHHATNEASISRLFAPLRKSASPLTISIWRFPIKSIFGFPTFLVYSAPLHFFPITIRPSA